MPLLSVLPFKQQPEWLLKKKTKTNPYHISAVNTSVFSISLRMKLKGCTLFYTALSDLLPCYLMLHHVLIKLAFLNFLLSATVTFSEKHFLIWPPYLKKKKSSFPCSLTLHLLSYPLTDFFISALFAIRYIKYLFDIFIIFHSV